MIRSGEPLTRSGSRPFAVPDSALLGAVTALLFAVHAWQFPETLVRIGSDTLLAAKFVKHPNLIPNSIYNLFFPNTVTLAQTIVGGLAAVGVNPYVIELGLMLLMIALAVSGVYLLTTGLWRDRLAAMIAVILVMETQFQNLGVSQRFAVGHAPLLQYIGLAGVVFVLGVWARGHMRIAWLVTGLLFNLHAAHAAAAALVLAATSLIGLGERRLREIFIGAGLAAVGTLPLLVYVFLVQWPQGLGLAWRDTVPPDEWWRLMTVRKYSILFPFMGNGRQWAFVLAFAIAGAMAWWYSLKRVPDTDVAKWRARYLPPAVAGAVTALCAVGTVFVTLVPVRAIASLALYRTVPYVLILAAVCIAKVLSDSLWSTDWLRQGVAIGCLLMAMLADEPGIMLLLSLVVMAVLTQGPWRRMWTAAIGLGALLSLGGHVLQIVLPNSITTSHVAWIVSRFDVSKRVWFFYTATVIVLLAQSVVNLPSIRVFAWTPLRRATCFTALFLLGLYPAAYAVPDIKRTGVEADWVEVQEWARTHTPEGTVFVTPPDQWGFELLSERAQIISVLEMGLSIYVPAIFPVEVDRTRDYGVDPLSATLRGKLDLGRALTRNYEQFTEADFLRLGRKHGATYAVVAAGRSLPFERVFRNARFLVYRLPVAR